jgi:ATP/maltotriose-dependent transcriptional regulator MalT
MVSLLQILKKRSTPGTLIFDTNNRLLYFNKEALEIIHVFQKTTKKRKKGKVPKIVLSLCNELKKSRGVRPFGQGMKAIQKVFRSKSKHPYSIQAFFIGGHRDKIPTHIMVLIQKIIEKHNIDYEKAQKEFKLSGRELEVLGAICKGLSNKEISKKLFITEYTVKDHMKKIMRKMGVTSRTQIISSLK